MPSLLQYREFPPGPCLVELVECFWAGTLRPAARTSSCHRVLPDGCMDLLFDFRAGDSRRASIIGTMSRPFIFTTSGPVDLLGIRFRPGGLAGFIALEAAELFDARVDLTNFWGLWAQETWHRLGEATPADRVGLLQELLGARANGRLHIDPFIRHCVARIEADRGSLRIGDLEKSTGLSARQLERKFAQNIGISPKTFARVVRFKSVVAAADRPDPPDWVRLAGDFGFADQPHLVREFKTFSGLTPMDYRHAANA
jgi:AraC-like DNA-binding protein